MRRSPCFPYVFMLRLIFLCSKRRTDFVKNLWSLLLTVWGSKTVGFGVCHLWAEVNMGKRELLASLKKLENLWTLKLYFSPGNVNYDLAVHKFGWQKCESEMLVTTWKTLEFLFALVTFQTFGSSPWTVCHPCDPSASWVTSTELSRGWCLISQEIYT